MRLIDPISLKQALAVSAILEDKKTIEQIIDEQPTIVQLSDEDMRLFKKLRSYHNGSYAKLLDKMMASAQPEIIRCKDCVNHVDDRCLVANHHTGNTEYCMEVFGAKRRGEQP